MTQKELRKRISRGISLILGAFWATFTITFGQLFGIRLGVIDARNIGHLALFPDLAIREFLHRFPRGDYRKTLWEVITPVSNSYLLELWMKDLKIRRSYFGIKSACGLLRWLGMYRLTVSTNNYLGSPVPVDPYQPAPLEVPMKTRATALREARISISAITAEKIVCLHVRDWTHDAKVKGIPESVAKTSLRNATFESFLPVIEFLCSQNFLVCLMGTHSHDTARFTHSNFVDVQKVSDGRDSTVDISLIAACTFFVAGSVSGLYDVARLFRKPILYCNYWPYLGMPINDAQSLLLPTTVVWRDSGRLVPLREIFAYTDDYLRPFKRSRGRFNRLPAHVTLESRPDWKIEQNSKHQLLMALKEFLSYRTEGFRSASALSHENAAFLENLPSPFPKITDGSRVAESFLALHREELKTFPKEETSNPSFSR